MNVQQSFVLSYEAQNLLLKRLGPSLALILSSLATVPGTHVEHTTVDSSAQVSNHAMLHLHMRNSHGSSLLVCSGLEGFLLGLKL